MLLSTITDRQMTDVAPNASTHCKISPSSFDECRLSANPQTKPTDFTCK